MKLRKHDIHRINQYFNCVQDDLFLRLDSAVSDSFLQVHLLLGFVVLASFGWTFVFAVGFDVHFEARAHVSQVSGLLVEGQP